MFLEHGKYLVLLQEKGHVVQCTRKCHHFALTCMSACSGMFARMHWLLREPVVWVLRHFCSCHLLVRKILRGSPCSPLQQSFFGIWTCISSADPFPRAAKQYPCIAQPQNICAVLTSEYPCSPPCGIFSRPGTRLKVEKVSGPTLGWWLAS